mgnify:CR=1 FL=1
MEDRKPATNWRMVRELSTLVPCRVPPYPRVNLNQGNGRLGQAQENPIDFGEGQGRGTDMGWEGTINLNHIHKEFVPSSLKGAGWG